MENLQDPETRNLLPPAAQLSSQENLLFRLYDGR